MQKWLSWFSNNSKKTAGGLPSIRDVKDLRGKRVLLRASLNVPIKDGLVAETFRLEQALPTLDFLKKEGAKVVVIGHIGREAHESLKPVFEALKTMTDIKWGGDVKDLQNGEAMLLENLRQDPRESEGDEGFSKELSALADIYVNDAFSDSHREHSSIVGVPKYLQSYFGDSFIREYEALKQVTEPQHPAIFILGGAKFETKMPLIERYAQIYDTVFIGGALANDIFKARGYEVGTSLISDIDLSGNPILDNSRIMLPTDVLVKNGGGEREVGARGVENHEAILDIGPTTLKELSAKLKGTKTILWNGPLGFVEKGYSLGTETLARAIAKSSAYSVVGGGDTIAAIRSLGLQDKFGFMSTAGGAMLVFLETGTLPAIEAVLNRR